MSFILRIAEYIYAKVIKIGRGRAITGGGLHPSSYVGSGSAFKNVNLGRYSYCGYDCTFMDVEIGAFCSIASRVTIGGAGHPMHFVSTSPAFLSHKDSIAKKFAAHDYLPRIRTSIGSDVWIGDGAILKAGICVGHGAVVGMGAVVTKNVPPYAIVAGNPAKIIRYRFPPEIVDELLRSEWWNLSDSELRRLGKHFQEPREMLDALAARSNGR